METGRVITATLAKIDSLGQVVTTAFQTTPEPNVQTVLATGSARDVTPIAQTEPKMGLCATVIPGTVKKPAQRCARRFPVILGAPFVKQAWTLSSEKPVRMGSRM